MGASSTLRFAILPLLLALLASPLDAQCDLQKLWAVQDIAPELAVYWDGVERVDFNTDRAVFTRRDGNDCVVIACPPYRYRNDTLTFYYAADDSLSVRLVSGACNLHRALRLGPAPNDKLFALYPVTDGQCAYPEGTACNVRSGGTSVTPLPSPRSPATGKWSLCPTCPSGDCNGTPSGWVPKVLRVVFWAFYLLYLVAFLVLWARGDTSKRNRCWVMLCVVTGIYSPCAIGPMALFAFHLSILVAYVLRNATPLNSIGRLAFYGAYSGLIALYEMIVSVGAERTLVGQQFGGAPLYFAVVPIIVFLCGGRLMTRVLRDAWGLGYGGTLYNLFLIGVLYFGPNLYVYSQRGNIVSFLQGIGVL